jgi:hypothetical protein
MTSEPITSDALPETIERAVMVGDLSDLTVPQRAEYYTAVCRSLGLNPLTKPFEFLTLNGKLRLYALRDCTDQLRRLHGISIYITNRERMGDIYIVTARAKDRTGREDESTGAVPLGNLKGDALANALMKAETKSKRRVTLSIAGLGWLDETELATIPGAQTSAPDAAHETTGISSHPLPVGEEGTSGAATPPVTNGHRPAQEPDESLAHPTESHLSALRTLALDTCHEDVEAFETRVRRTAGLPAHASLAPKLLCRTLSMKTYMEVYGWYVNLEKQLAKGQGKEATDGATPASPVVASTAPAATGEAPATVPLPAATASSSAAPGPTDAAERDRARLRAEVAQWDLRVPPEEVEHVIQHNPYSKARALLWKCRRQDTAAD